MPLFSTTELQTLTQATASPCVSIYIPTHEAGPEIQQDPIRLKNQLSEAEDQLVQQGMSAGDAEAMLKPAADLLEDGNFWRHQQGGLALFIASDMFRTYRVPLDFETFTTVGEQFYTKPLLPLITDDGQFYVLAASQNQVMLYQATRDQVQSVDLGDTPRSLEVALRYDDPEESLQGHSTGRNGSPEVFHGQGGGKDSENSDILRFFHLVSDGVEKTLGGSSAPLVFVGVDFLFPIYQQANKYPHLMENAVDHQPDQLSPEEIRDRALEIVTPHFDKNRQLAVEQYGSLLNQGQATEDLSKVMTAAYDGQIDTLFVAKDAQVWGQYDPKSRELEQQAEAASDDGQENGQELLNLAVAQAFSTGAKVYIIEQDQMPTQSVVAAILRYPLLEEMQSSAEKEAVTA